jgi:D,D-heptose 1,7-bisphosphate phosphatase
MRRAVFLDKDGTLVEDVPYNVKPELIRLAPGAEEALRKLHHAGYLLVIITNQAGVARGFFSEHELASLEQTFREIFQNQIGVPLAGFYYCPHHPQGTIRAYALECDCRKPAPGLLLHAARDLEIDLSRSWMIGDILNDVEAGKSAGCSTMLVDNGNETEWVLTEARRPEFIVNNLIDAADFILEGK